MPTDGDVCPNADNLVVFRPLTLFTYCQPAGRTDSILFSTALNKLSGDRPRRRPLRDMEDGALMRDCDGPR